MSKANQRIAAEKHFEKKESVYRKQIAQQQTVISEAKSENLALKTRLQELELKTLQQKEWIERLLRYTELDVNDVKAACEADKKRSALFDMFTALGGAFRC